MDRSSGRPKEIDLGENFGDVVIKANGARIEVGADSRVIVTSGGGVELRSAADGANTGAGAVLQIGDEMKDGTIYAGISPDIGKPMYVTPGDAPGAYTFDRAARYASTLDAHGHRDFRVPGKNELLALFRHRDKGRLKGTFNEAGSYPAVWYWSSAPDVRACAWAQRFSDGNQHYLGTDSGFSLRCVRG